jgi:hypothetical protein
LQKLFSYYQERVEWKELLEENENEEKMDEKTLKNITDGKQEEQDLFAKNGFLPSTGAKSNNNRYNFLSSPPVLSLSSSISTLIHLSKRIEILSSNSFKEFNQRTQTYNKEQQQLIRDYYQKHLEIEFLSLASVVHQFSQGIYQIFMQKKSYSHPEILQLISNLYVILGPAVLEGDVLFIKEYTPDKTDSGSLNWEFQMIILLKFLWKYFLEIFGSFRNEKVQIIFYSQNPFKNQSVQHQEFNYEVTSKLFYSFIPLIKAHEKERETGQSETKSSPAKSNTISTVLGISNPSLAKQNQQIQNNLRNNNASNNFLALFMETSFDIILSTILGHRTSWTSSLTEKDKKNYSTLTQFCKKLEFQNIEKFIRSEFLNLFLIFLQFMNDLKEEEEDLQWKDGNSESHGNSLSAELMVGHITKKDNIYKRKALIFTLLENFVDEFLYGLCNEITILEVKVREKIFFIYSFLNSSFFFSKMFLKIIFNLFILYEKYLREVQDQLKLIQEIISRENPSLTEIEANSLDDLKDIYLEIVTREKKTKEKSLSIIFRLILSLEYLFQCNEIGLIQNTVSLIFMIW